MFDLERKTMRFLRAIAILKMRAKMGVIYAFKISLNKLLPNLVNNFYMMTLCRGNHQKLKPSILLNVYSMWWLKFKRKEMMDKIVLSRLKEMLKRLVSIRQFHWTLMMSENTIMGRIKWMKIGDWSYKADPMSHSHLQNALLKKAPLMWINSRWSYKFKIKNFVGYAN